MHDFCKEIGVDSHSPHGECGLKLLRCPARAASKRGHSPHGECGLKLGVNDDKKDNGMVTPHTGSVD